MKYTEAAIERLIDIFGAYLTGETTPMFNLCNMFSPVVVPTPENFKKEIHKLLAKWSDETK